MPPKINKLIPSSLWYGFFFSWMNFKTTVSVQNYVPGCGQRMAWCLWGEKWADWVHLCSATPILKDTVLIVKRLARSAKTILLSPLCFKSKDPSKVSMHEVGEGIVGKMRESPVLFGFWPSTDLPVYKLTKCCLCCLVYPLSISPSCRKHYWQELLDKLLQSRLRQLIIQGNSKCLITKPEWNPKSKTLEIIKIPSPTASPEAL